MSLLVQAQTSDDDGEIMGCLQMVLSSSKLGLIHESVNVDYSTSYTRTFFFILFAPTPLLTFLFSFPFILLSPLFSFPCETEPGLRELVCLGERRVCRDDIKSGETETAFDIRGFEALRVMMNY
jgi:hypothetical protein